MPPHTRQLLALLTALAGAVQPTLSQDCAYDTDLCDCLGYFVVSCTNLQSIPPLVSNETEYEHARFSYGNISGVYSTSLPPGLISIEFTDHPLTNISDDAFDNIATTLKVLTISGAKLKRLPGALLKLTSLLSLEITDTPVEALNSSILQQIGKTLIFLTLANVSLSGWPDLTNCQILTRINFSGTPIQSIPGNAFVSFKDRLSDLTLKQTSLTHVPRGLSILTDLKSLDLSSNNFLNFNDIESMVFNEMGDLHLNLQSVGLNKILNFSNWLNLLEIDLSNNNISDATSGEFPPSLLKLQLAGNNLPSVPVVVASMSHLENLNLSENVISSLRPNSFHPALRMLDLSSNKIHKVNNDSFPSNLTILSLESNEIPEITPGMLPSNLQKLTLMFNNIKEIKAGSLPRSLTSIDLSYNQITRIDPNVFPSSLQTLDLQHNELTSIEYEFYNLTLLTLLSLNNNPILAISVSAFSDLEQLTLLNLDSTNLTRVPLALSKLPNAGTYISMYNIVSLSCSCLIATEASDWAAFPNRIGGRCHDDYSIDDRLTPCTTTTSFDTTTTDTVIRDTTAGYMTTTPNSAPSHHFHVIIVCGLLTSVLFLYTKE